MGANETFGRDTDDRDIISRELLRLSARVTRRMRTGGVAGRTVTITVRFADFTTITRSKTIPEATDGTREVHRTALRLYDALGLQRARIRLVGVRVEGWCRARPCIGSWCWVSGSMGGAMPTGSSTAPGSGSGQTRSVPRALL
jgi:nucleotidyltransferase/DNA polymerase involved in DNA repair